MEAVPGSSFSTRIALRSRAWCDHDLYTFHKEGNLDAISPRPATLAVLHLPGSRTVGFENHLILARIDLPAYMLAHCCSALSPTTVAVYYARQGDTLRNGPGFFFMLLYFLIVARLLLNVEGEALTYVSSSEECHSLHQPGSVLFAQPAEVDNWCHSIYPDSVYPLTPPDTASDCAPSDCPDMYDPSWTQASLPEDSWTMPSASDYSALLASNRQWTTGSVVSSSRQDVHDLSTLDDSWVHASQGSVDTGLSPVLSHESQTAHNLHPIPGSDFSMLPPGLDLSFIGEPTAWNASAPVVDATVPQDVSATMLSSPMSMPAGPPSQSSVCHPLPMSEPVMYGPHQPMFAFPEYPIQYQRPASDLSAASPRRLLPRMDVPALPAHYASGYDYSLQPQLPVFAAEGVARVSSQNFSQDSNVAGTTHGHGLMTPPPRPEQSSPGLIPAPSSMSDPGCDEFSSFVRYDQEESAPPVQMRFENVIPRVLNCDTDLPRSSAPDAASAPAPSSGHRQEMTPALSRSDSVGSKATSTASVSGETDEGRHRNHPLYSKGPEADGLYHCPFTSDPSCQHKPTKLKCNYEYVLLQIFLCTRATMQTICANHVRNSKFIDSHLKPFRCKVESCSKQEFSSTACLLRHEREAHGMHGHGERPHLCFYPGCERGIPGHGFPRRYNLFDHMKRVHDHKEEPQHDRAAADNGARKPASRKRKAVATSDEPAARRLKTQPVPSQALAVPQEYSVPVALYPEQAYRPVPGAQRNVYSQWDHPNKLVAFQMDSMSTLGANVTSQQARHG